MIRNMHKTVLIVALWLMASVTMSCSSDDPGVASPTATLQPPTSTRISEATPQPTAKLAGPTVAAPSPTPTAIRTPEATITAPPIPEPPPASTATATPIPMTPSRDGTPTKSPARIRPETPSPTPGPSPTPVPTPDVVATPTEVPTKTYGPVPATRSLVPWELGLETALHRAVLDSNLEVAQDLMGEGSDLEAEAYITFPDGDPPPGSPLHQWFELTYTLRPLHLAAWSGGPDMVALLLDSGADIEARGGEWNALYFALAHNPNPVTVALLLDRGSSLNPTSSASETPLHQAARFNTNPAIVDLLLDRGISSVNAHSNYGGTPLHQRRNQRLLRPPHQRWSRLLRRHRR